MGMVFLRTSDGLIDLRHPLTIGINSTVEAVQVFVGKPVAGEIGETVARLDKKERDSGNTDLQLRAISDSLARAIAYAMAYTDKANDNMAWILSFESTGDAYWTLNRADENPGVTPVYHLK